MTIDNDRLNVTTEATSIEVEQVTTNSGTTEELGKVSTDLVVQPATGNSIMVRDGWRSLPAKAEDSVEVVLALHSELKTEIIEAGPSRAKELARQIRRMESAAPSIIGLVKRGQIETLGDVHDIVEFVSEGRENRAGSRYGNTETTSGIKMSQVREIARRQVAKGQTLSPLKLACSQEIADATGVQLDEVDQICDILGLDVSDEFDGEIVTRQIERAKIEAKTVGSIVQAVANLTNGRLY